MLEVLINSLFNVTGSKYFTWLRKEFVDLLENDENAIPASHSSIKL